MGLRLCDDCLAKFLRVLEREEVGEYTLPPRHDKPCELCEEVKETRLYDLWWGVYVKQATSQGEAMREQAEVPD